MLPGGNAGSAGVMGWWLMIFLPMIERELRRRARGWAVYVMRMAAAAVGMAVCVQLMLANPALRSPAAVGQSVFDGLVLAAFIVSCTACFFAADTISTERREGTLGLLLLTRIRSSEVLVAKSASAGVASLSMVVAFLPALALPVLAGGVATSEVVRNGAALMSTVWFALGVGLLASAISRERAKANAWALVAMLVFVLLTYVCFLSPAGGLFWCVGLMSPLTLMVSGGRTQYLAAPEVFWASLVFVQVAGWFFLYGAAAVLRRMVREDSVEPERPRDTRARSQRALELARWRPDKEDANPVEWLMYRQRGIGAWTWSLAVVGIVCSRWMALLLQWQGPASSTVWLLTLPLGLGAALAGRGDVCARSQPFLRIGAADGRTRTPADHAHGGDGTDF